MKRIPVSGSLLLLTALGGLMVACVKSVTLVEPAVKPSAYSVVADTNLTNVKYTNYSVQFIDQQTGWITSSLGRILKTADGGTTWTVQKSTLTLPTGSTTLPNILAIYMVDATTGYAVGASGTILKTTDGLTWTTQKSGLTTSINAVHFADKNTGICVAASGGILTTADGGTTWTAQKSGVTVTLSGVKYLDAKTIYAVGNTGTLLRSVDAGKTWTGIPTGLTTNLLALQLLPGAGLAYACGNSGLVIRIDLTTNVIKNLSLAQDDTQRGLFFVNESVGYVVGNYGEVNKTENGGQTWQTQNIDPVAYSMYGVSFPNAKTGFLVGQRVGIKAQQ